ncbi:MAG: class I SAM-dependent methyltransferase [bacterium]|nr:class I SAM-dependent methyltransferase [bacterium]
MKNMPSRAQFLPSGEELKFDKRIILKIFQCKFCGVVQLQNKPVEYFKDVIRATGISDEMKRFREKQFMKFVKDFSLKGKKIIEIGCGAGEFLSIMGKTGVRAYGIEHNRELVEKCRKKGLMVVKDFVAGRDHILKYAPFDGFVMMSYLEHLPDPCGILKGIYNNLKDNAAGIVEVPNFDMILRKKLFSEFMLDHLFYFTKDTLETVLSLSGFEVLECKEIWQDYIISAIVRKRKIIDFSVFLSQQKKLCTRIDNYLSKFEDKKVAVWGAGHQALTILCFLKMLKKIKYVVDSAPFKQGRFTPATHIPIVSPETLNLDPVEAIIVMAGSYSREVVKIIKKQFQMKIEVKVLDEQGLK